MKYDVVLVLSGKPDGKASQDKYATLLEKEGFSVLENNLWGNKLLAYPLKKKNEGMYLHYVITSTTATPKSLNARFKLDDAVVRTIILKQVIKKVKKIRSVAKN